MNSDTRTESNRSSSEKNKKFELSAKACLDFSISYLPPPLHHGLYGDADASQHSVPLRLGRGHNQLPVAHVAGHGLRRKHNRHLSDNLGGHLDDLCGPEHRTDPV